MARFAYFCGHEQWQPEVLVSHAMLAEQAGFDFLVVSEHFHPWVDDTSAAGYAFSTIGAMAQATERVGIATGVTTPLFRYHPAVVAQAAATMDRLSGGRFHLGVGTGENLNEGPLGYPFPNYSGRAARMREALQIMRRLLDGEKLTFSGDFYRTDHARLYSPPVGPVPIWLAAGGPKSATLAAELADGIITSVKDPAATIESVVAPARSATEAGGRPPLPLMASRWSVRAETEDEAWQALSAWRGLRAPGRLEAVDPQVLRERADAMDRAEVLGRYSLVATPADYVAVYAPLVTELNADIVVIQTTSLDQPGTIAMLGEEVLPELRRLG
jgi:coenzyme F420-dependent glucose-6-phosphate dehydrogenase